MEDIIQLKIKLQDSKPPIWRRILLNKNTDFYNLHTIIQTTMGWEDYHLFEFNINNYRIGKVSEEYSDMGYGNDELVDASSITLENVISNHKEKFIYNYDFGDGWTHQITVEKFLPLDTNIQYPICIKGKLSCPPEDCGGVWGYYNLLKIVKDKKNPEREAMLEWLGEDFDENYFNLDEVNKLLS